MSARPAYINIAFNGGEVSERFAARQDQNKYLASVAQALNWIPTYTGSMRFREGTKLVARAKEDGQPIRLMRFLYNDTQAYLFEVSSHVIRIYANNALVTEISHPYNSAILSLLYDFQSADVKYVCSDGSIPLYKISRTDPSTFLLQQVSYSTPPLEEDEPTGTQLNSGNLTLSAVTGHDINITASNNLWLKGDVGRVVVSGAGRAQITSMSSGEVVVADVISNFASTSITAANWFFRGSPVAGATPTSAGKNHVIKINFDTPCMRSEDDGKVIFIYGGSVQITRVNSSTQISGIVVENMNDAPLPISTKTFIWTLNSAKYANGQYPTCGTFFQNRMFLGRNQDVDGSVTADFENFAQGSGDDAGISRTIASDEINPVLAMASDTFLQFYTRSGEYFVTPSSQDGPLTSKDFNVKPASTNGTRRIKPIMIEGRILSVESGGRHVREQIYDVIQNKYRTPDLLNFADHLTEKRTILRTALQRRPWRIMWCVMDDGNIIGLVYNTEQEIAGWFQWQTTGRIKDVCILPRTATNSDVVYFAIERDLPSGTRTFIEQIEDFDLTITSREWQEHYTDCSIMVTPTLGSAVLTGLDHLEGMTVSVIGDGMLFNPQVVTGGQINIDPFIDGLTQFEVGLSYANGLTPLEPVVPKELGGPLMARGWEVAGVRVRRTMGIQINGTQIPFRQPTDVLDAQIPLKKGKIGISSFKSDGKGLITITQPVPFPAEVLCLMGRVAIGDEPSFVLENQNV